MPIYEFYCAECHTIFNFFSRKVDTATRPPCPRCRKTRLERQVSMFAATGKAREEGEGGEAGDLPVDEGKMEGAMEALAGEAEGLDENDPRQAAQLMRKFSKMTGMEFGRGMEEALGRLEAGENPEQIEQELGDAMEGEDPFVLPGGKGRKKDASARRGAPARDKTLYEMP
jgi:putative FmdB family regulatory protein